MPPGITLQFVANGIRYTLPLRLPVVLTNFVGTSKLSKPRFTHLWKSLGSEEKQTEGQIPIGPNCNDLDKIRKLICYKDGDDKTRVMKFAIVEDIDVDPSLSMTCVGILQTMKMGKNSKSTQYGTLLRIVKNPEANAFQLTVRSSSQVAGAAIYKILKSQLS